MTDGEAAIMFQSWFRGQQERKARQAFVMMKAVARMQVCGRYLAPNGVTTGVVLLL